MPLIIFEKLKTESRKSERAKNVGVILGENEKSLPPFVPIGGGGRWGGGGVVAVGSQPASGRGLGGGGLSLELCPAIEAETEMRWPRKRTGMGPRLGQLLEGSPLWPTWLCINRLMVYQSVIRGGVGWGGQGDNPPTRRTGDGRGRHTRKKT